MQPPHALMTPSVNVARADLEHEVKRNTTCGTGANGAAENSCAPGNQAGRAANTEQHSFGGGRVTPAGYLRRVRLRYTAGASSGEQSPSTNYRLLALDHACLTVCTIDTDPPAKTPATRHGRHWKDGSDRRTAQRS